MKIKNLLSNPNLYYKLDPGEPGLLQNARANESIMKVTAQERRNLRRLESEARLKGRKVLFSDIKYSYGIDGSFSSIRAGETTVVSVEENTPEIQPLMNSEESEESTNEPENSEYIVDADKDDIEEELKRLEIEKERLKNELDELNFNSNGNDNFRNDLTILLEYEEIEDKISKLEFEKKRLELQEQQTNVNNSILDNADIAEKFSRYKSAGFMNRTRNTITGQFLDIRG